jgi:hypothetical protein
MLAPYLLGSLVLAFAPVASAQAGAGPSADPTIFQAIVHSEAGQAHGLLLTDIRPVRAGADLLAIDEDDLGAASRARGDLLRRMHLQATDILADKACMFARGVPAPPGHDSLPPEMAEVRARCRARPEFTSIAVSEVQGGDADSIRVNVVRVTTSRYRVVEYTLLRSGSGYRIAGQRDVFNITS